MAQRQSQVFEFSPQPLPRDITVLLPADDACDVFQPAPTAESLPHTVQHLLLS